MSASREPRTPSEGGQVILDALATPVFAVDRSHRYTAFNPAHAAVMRYAYGAEIELGGDLFAYHTVALDGELVQASFGRALSGETVSHRTWVGQEAARRFYWTTHSPIRADDEIVGVAVVALDLTEQETALQNQRRLAAIVASSDDAILSKTLDGTITTWNPAAERMYGYAPAEIIGKSVSLLTPPGAEEQLEALLERVGRGEAVNDYEAVRVRKDGSRLDVSLCISPIRDEAGVIVGASTIARDVTERKRVKEMLKESQERLEEAHRLAHIGIWTWRVADDTVTWSEELYRIVGRDPSSPAPTYAEHPDLYVPESWDRLQAAVEQASERGTGYDLDLELIRPDGTIRCVHVFGGATRNERGEVESLYGTVQDISERKRAEEELLLSRQWHSLHVEQTPLAVIEFDLEGTVRGWNPSAIEIFGYSCEEAIGQHLTFLVPDAERGYLEGVWEDLLTQRGGSRAANENVTKSGRIVSCEWFNTPLKDENGAVIGVAALALDVTERVQAEEALAASEARYRSYVDDAPYGVFVTDAQGGYVEVNQVAAEQTGYSRSELEQMNIIALLAPESLESGRKGFENLVLTGTLSRSLVLLRKDGTRLPVRLDAVRLSATRYLGFIVDVSEQQRAEDDILAGAAQLEQTLTATIAALGAVTELRDPYTAGHQRRVAQLAGAIAVELGWSDERITSLRTAGQLHDIGKIVVPAEILSKPGRLTEMEMELVRQHAAASAALMASIEFGSPVAAMVNQHHERLDGSGYPAGLVGAQILPEARVLAVADCVEAMASHRPYRPSLGIEAALEEVLRGAGVGYDADVVAACESIFAAGFVFAE